MQSISLSTVLLDLFHSKSMISPVVTKLVPSSHSQQWNTKQEGNMHDQSCPRAPDVNSIAMSEPHETCLSLN
jgi:hypothetical protein